MWSGTRHQLGDLDGTQTRPSNVFVVQAACNACFSISRGGAQLLRGGGFVLPPYRGHHKLAITRQTFEFCGPLIFAQAGVIFFFLH